MRSEENFSKGEHDALVSRCTRTKIKKKMKKREKREKERERVRECALSERGSSISVDRIPKRKRTPHLPPSTATAAGPLRRPRDADRRVFMFAPRISPRRPGVPTRKRTSNAEQPLSHSPRSSSFFLRLTDFHELRLRRVRTAGKRDSSVFF